jgi:hypothetical protein
MAAAAFIFIFVIPPPRTGDVSWGWLAPVARDALAVDDPVAPGVLLPCSSAMLVRRRFDEVQVHFGF